MRTTHRDGIIEKATGSLGAVVRAYKRRHHLQRDRSIYEADRGRKRPARKPKEKK
jgi:hypothetical protein